MQMRSESFSSDDVAFLGRPAKARKSNIYDAVAGKHVAKPCSRGRELMESKGMLLKRA
jgi:hypothetical protein